MKKKVLVVDPGSKFCGLANQVAEFINGNGLAVLKIAQIPNPEVAELFNSFVFLTRDNIQQANNLDMLFPTKAVIVLSEELRWEDGDGTVIFIDKQDPKFLENLLDSIHENGSETLSKGDIFTFPRGRDYSDGYGMVLNDGSAVLVLQGGGPWYVERASVPPKAKKIKFSLIPTEIMLALEATRLAIR